MSKYFISAGGNADFQLIQLSAAPNSVRVEFIKKTYLHLAGAIFGFILLEAILFHLPFTETLIRSMIGEPYSWLIVLGTFMIVSAIASKWAVQGGSIRKQYAGLSLYVVAEAIIFLPLLYIANAEAPGVISQAALITLFMVVGLTLVAYTSKSDFSFLGPILKIGGMVGLGLIVGAIFFEMSLGLWFSVIMVIFASGSILHTTSNILQHYRTDMYVAASLALFAGVALLFWYVLRILMAMRK